MNRKLLLGSAIAAALMFGANLASACAISAWSSATGLTVADTGGPSTGFSRYSGACSLRVGTTGAHFVQDNTPADEKGIKIRFYYFTGDITGTTPVFRARNTGGTSIINITHDGNQLSFTTNTGGAAQNVTVVDNRYYSIELSWTAGTVSPATTGTMTATVTGNSGGSVPALVAGTVNFTGLANTADSITDTQMGLITGATAVTAPVYFDEYDSRRTTVPGRLCRGDAGGGAGGAADGAIGSQDRILVTNEILGTGTQPRGQPDANEDGAIGGQDRIAITNMILAAATCP